MIKSPIKWAGGKSFLLPKINQDFISSQQPVFIEPFCGSAVVSLNISSQKTIANDINFNLINFFSELETLYIDTDSYSYTEAEYYLFRREYNFLKNTSKYPKRLAELFYYLNKAGFNGLYRENKKGEFNVPWGKRKYIPRLNLYDLSYIQFTNYAYQDLIIPSNSFMYLDPPYDSEFTTYSKEGFNWSDQILLIEWASKLNVPFIISNQSTSRIKELYSDYKLNIEYIEAPRRIACNGNRNNQEELYAKNF